MYFAFTQKEKAVTLFQDYGFFIYGAEGRNRQKFYDINNLLKAICIFLNLNVNLYNPGCVSHIKCIFKLENLTCPESGAPARLSVYKTADDYDLTKQTLIDRHERAAPGLRIRIAELH
jgi:hypothetical protein